MRFFDSKNAQRVGTKEINLYFCRPLKGIGCVVGTKQSRLDADQSVSTQLNRASRPTIGKVLGRKVHSKKGCVAKLNRASRRTLGKVLGRRLQSKKWLRSSTE